MKCTKCEKNMYKVLIEPFSSQGYYECICGTLGIAKDLLENKQATLNPQYRKAIKSTN